MAANAAGQNATARTKPAQSRGDVFETTVKYVEQFYPLWFTYYQTRFATPNVLVGPDKISPIYHYVVAINDDTLYVSSFLDLSGEPVILTIPESSDLSYSVLMLDPYCDKIMQTAITPPASGTFALYGPGFKGTLPAGVTPVPLPLNYMALLFRVDKFKNGVDRTLEADNFRKANLFNTQMTTRQPPTITHSRMAMACRSTEPTPMGMF